MEKGTGRERGREGRGRRGSTKIDRGRDKVDNCILSRLELPAR